MTGGRAAEATLRDRDGREFKTKAGDGTVTVDGVDLVVRHAQDGSVEVGSTDRVLAWTTAIGDERWVFVDGRTYVFTVERAGGAGRRRTRSGSASLAAPMPATVRQVLVSTGDTVKAGDLLIVLEAMKMELPVRADAAGTVRAVNCREGEMVQPGEPLVDIASSSPDE